MIGFLYQAGLSNACFACLLALFAMLVGRKLRQPQVMHLLWLLVLVKLITPPVLNLPITFSATTTPIELTAVDEEYSAQVSKPIAIAADKASIASGGSVEIWGKVRDTATFWLGRIWLLGTGLIVGWSLIRIWRFHRLLNQSLEMAPQHVGEVAERFSHQLGLKNLPVLSVTTAQLSPMVWWVGGKVRVVLPKSMFDRMREDQWQWVVAHELAHVRRRDYLVRWLEWSACACFWWNPVVWWAQRNLRATEEACCDNLVLSSLNPGSHTYAKSIVQAVESLVCRAIRPPAMASEINSGGFLERRIEMILSNGSPKPPSGFLRLGVAAMALLLIPLGIVQAQDTEAVKRRLSKAVQQDEITFEQAAIMMEALERSSKHHAGQEERKEREEVHEEERRREFRHAAMEIEEAVEAGEITREQAGEKLQGLKKELWGHDKGESREGERAHRYRRAEMEIKELHEAGKITREQASERLQGLKKELRGHDKGESREDERAHRYRRAEMEIKELHEAGKITREQAGERLQGLKKELWDHDRGESREDERAHRYRQAEIEIKELLEAEKITREHAEERLSGLKKRLRGGDHEDERKDAYQQAATEIKELVEAGKLTREEAGEKLGALKKRLSQKTADARDGEQRERSPQDRQAKWDAIEKRIEAAVTAGDITRQQADSTYQSLKERAKIREAAEDERSND